MRPHTRQPTRLPHPWDSPGKNTGVSCHFLLQCMKVKSESEVAQSCPTLSDPMDCSLPGSSVHGFSRQKCWSGVPLPSLIITLLSCKKKIVQRQQNQVKTPQIDDFILVTQENKTGKGVEILGRQILQRISDDPYKYLEGRYHWGLEHVWSSQPCPGILSNVKDKFLHFAPPATKNEV